jgi:hypothetical protein
VHAEKKDDPSNAAKVYSYKVHAGYMKDSFQYQFSSRAAGALPGSSAADDSLMSRVLEFHFTVSQLADGHQGIDVKHWSALKSHPFLTTS